MKRALSILASLSIMAGLLLIALPLPASATADTCAELGYENLTSSVSGVWGSIDFDADEPTLTLTVEEGWEVNICVKAGSAQQGDGPEILGWFGEGEYSLSHSTGKELSHFGFLFREVEDESTTTLEEPTTTTTTTEPTTTTTLIDGSTTTTLIDGSTTTTLVEVNPICIDCNNATLADLMQLTGVNATLAQSIIDNRPYETVQDLVTKGVMTPLQIILILAINADTGAFASDLCLEPVGFGVTTTTAVTETTSPFTDSPTTTLPGTPPTTTPGTLPFTGSESRPLGLLSAVLIGAGALVLFAVRKLEA